MAREVIKTYGEVQRGDILIFRGYPIDVYDAYFCEEGCHRYVCFCADNVVKISAFYSDSPISVLLMDDKDRERVDSAMNRLLEIAKVTKA